MIVTAGLLVLLGFGLFVGGLLTGVTALYWSCVAACVVAAGVLIAARRKMAARSASATTPPATAPAVPPAAAGPDLATGATAAPPTAAPTPATVQETPPDTHPEPGTAPVAGPAAGATAASVAAAQGPEAPVELPDPPVEEVEVTDLLIIVDLTDEVLVVDEHPRYHVPGCVHLQGHSPIPLPLDEARTDGFTPCGVCRPDRTLAKRARARR
ncbi:hypothetical protein ABC795_07395 [Blastococcus sp. HT6-30]|uniref:hypothetical protein n=1 Tax=Blastococcus sp. HT6-30 TaxID=3144843 RepID=UPI00321934A0